MRFSQPPSSPRAPHATARPSPTRRSTRTMASCSIGRACRCPAAPPVPHLARPSAAAAAARCSCAVVARASLPPNGHADQSETVGAPPQQHQRRPVQQAVAQPSTALLALTGFALVAGGVLEPGSRASALAQLWWASSSAQAADAAAADAVDIPASPILQLDQAAHAFVAAHTSAEFRGMADVAISDAAITLGIAGWLWCTTACLTKAPSKSAGVLALCWAAYYSTCGAVGHGDAPLVDSLKHFFARARPSDLHHSFSFPSGHTSAAVFIVGALMVVLVPLTAQLLASGEDAGQQQGSGSSSGGGSGGRGLAASAMPDAAVLGICFFAWLTTATGRVLAEAHWVSDTLAGGLLACACVSLLAWAGNWMLIASGDGSRGAVREEQQ